MAVHIVNKGSFFNFCNMLWRNLLTRRHPDIKNLLIRLGDELAHSECDNAYETIG